MCKRAAALLCLVGILVLLSSPIFVVKAQAPSWTAWLYDYDHGTLMYIDNTMKAPNSLTLPLPTTSTPSYNVVLSPDAEYVVYTGTDTQNTLYVYSRSQQQVVYQSSAKSRVWGLSDIADSGIFDETSTRLAVAYADPADFRHWGIDIINLKSGNIETSLTPNGLEEQGIVVRGDIPTVRRYRNGEVAFTFIFIPDMDVPPQVTYQWNISSGKLSLSGAYPSNVSTDTYDPTGETISGFPDSRLPNCDCVCSEFGTPSNALSIYDPATQTHFPFFTAANETFDQPIFGQDGQTILVRAQGRGTLKASPPSSLPGPKYVFKGGAITYWVVSRSGKLRGRLTDELPVFEFKERGYGQRYVGWQNGFLYLSTPSYDSTKISLVSVNTVTGLVNTRFTGHVVWEAPSNMHLLLIPAPSNMTSKGPFLAWKRLRPALGGAVFPPASSASSSHPECGYIYQNRIDTVLAANLVFALPNTALYPSSR